MLYRIIALLVVVLLIVMNIQTGESSPRKPRLPHSAICKRLQANPAWSQALRDTESKWGVPIPIQLSIIYHESKFKATAKSPYSTAYGYPQALDGTWSVYKAQVNTDATRDDFSAATDFIGWYADQMHESLGIGKDDAYKLYIAYHDGSGGYKKTVKRPHSTVSRLAKRVETTAQRYQKELAFCSI